MVRTLGIFLQDVVSLPQKYGTAHATVPKMYWNASNAKLMAKHFNEEAYNDSKGLANGLESLPVMSRNTIRIKNKNKIRDFSYSSS
jgi:hypothetical protein